MKHTYPKGKCEFIRYQAKQRFDKVRTTWIDCGRWALPHKTTWLLSQVEGQRHNHHIVDTTHILALRSYVAGFLEGNTSATRPWYRTGTPDSELNLFPANHEWLDKFTRATLSVFSRSNFYHAAGAFYYDYGVFNTGAYYIEERDDNRLFFHNLTPGGYFVLNDAYGESAILVREFSLTIKAIVDRYGKKVDGKYDWSNFSPGVRTAFEKGNYAQTIDIVNIVKSNDDFDPELPQALLNKKWISLTYESGSSATDNFGDSQDIPSDVPSTDNDETVYLEVKGSRRKPFVVGKSDTTNNYEYGMIGPTINSLGLIKSLNKKAISKDQALDQMLRPTLQGPARLKKSYITNAPGGFVPLDAATNLQGGLRAINEVNPAVAAITADVDDLRRQVDKHYYADFLLFLSQNPKTRTATETNAVVREQQLVIGPNLQSLNFTHNVPVVEFVMDYVLDTDPTLPPPPDDLAGNFIAPDFISVFAQAQRAADLPSIDRYVAMISGVGQINPKILDKLNLDKLADLYEDRLYLPAGLNNPQEKVEKQRQQALVEQQRQQQLEAMSQTAKAAKDVGLQVNNEGE